LKAFIGGFVSLLVLSIAIIFLIVILIRTKNIQKRNIKQSDSKVTMREQEKKETVVIERSVNTVTQQLISTTITYQPGIVILYFFPLIWDTRTYTYK
jgi:uncharacterized protein YoxC